MNYSSSEKLINIPNVNSLVKISAGLIFLTILSTALVYAETTSDETFVVTILENGYLESTPRYFDTSMFSVTTGTFVTIVNEDVVSHKFFSGTSNSSHSKEKFDDYLICELGERIAPAIDNQQDDNICDFNKDDRIIIDELLPGESISIEIVDAGTYRLIEPDYPWIDLLVYSFPKTEISSDIIEEKITEDSQVIENVNLINSPIIQNISVDGISHNVEYTVQGMAVNEIESDSDSKSLIFSVGVTDLNGILDITFERSFFDSIYDNVDDSFFILSDGDETIFEETKTAESRTLSIVVSSGTEELEIIGSIFNNFETPVIETPVIETPVIETPVIETPVIETPVIETPVIETPVIETPVIEDNLNNSCGPGTVLKNSICVLDERCGPGTILEGGVCILDSVSVPSPPSGDSRELIMSVTVAFVLAGVIGIIFALISKANKNKH